MVRTTVSPSLEHAWCPTTLLAPAPVVAQARTDVDSPTLSMPLLPSFHSHQLPTSNLSGGETTRTESRSDGLVFADRVLSEEYSMTPYRRGTAQERDGVFLSEHATDHSNSWLVGSNAGPSNIDEALVNSNATSATAGINALSLEEYIESWDWDTQLQVMSLSATYDTCMDLDIDVDESFPCQG